MEMGLMAVTLAILANAVNDKAGKLMLAAVAIGLAVAGVLMS